MIGQLITRIFWGALVYAVVLIAFAFLSTSLLYAIALVITGVLFLGWTLEHVCKIEDHIKSNLPPHL